MKTELLIAQHESIVRNYFSAFVRHDVDRMMTDIHPALHYIRSLNGKLDTVMNGAENFRKYMEHYATHLNESTLQLTRNRNDLDCIDMHFDIDTVSIMGEAVQHLNGRVVFWFMENQIFQIATQVDIQ